MKTRSQEQIVVEKLKTDGEVTRNWCLRRYISRLSAIVYDLRDKGWVLEGKYRKTANGRDYVYKLVKSPDNA